MTDVRTYAVPGRARTSHGTSSTSGRKRWAAGALATAVAVSTLGVLTPPASAAISAAGPIDPASEFPSYYTDSNGLSLALCEDGGFLCLSGPEKIQDNHAAGLEDEAFYYVADAQTSNFVLHNALEAAYSGPGQEVVFMRTQVTSREGGLRPNTTYRVTDPYGNFTCTSDAEGTIKQNACRIETEPVAGEFNRALGGRIGPFLVRDPAAPAPQAGYLGAIEDYHKVVGSPTGFNAFRVVGPGLTGTCTDTDGSTIQNCQQTDRFFTLGKIADTGVPSASVSQGALDFGDVPATPVVTKTLTYANTGVLPVDITSIGITTSPSAFSQTHNCPVLPAQLAPGARCSVDVTFTPEVGKASSATLSIVDNTPAGTRNIQLTGKNVGKMVQVEPPVGTALAFGDQQINVASGEINVVIGNTGKGPLTVNPPIINGFSASHFRLGANNTCTTPVNPGSGCEISVVFRPTTTGGKTANLQVTDSVGGVLNVPLSGRGVNTDSIAPSAPTLTATRSGTTANLSWTAATDNVGVTGYRVYRNGVQVGAELPATQRTFADTGLVPGTYAYTVRAVDAVGNASVASNTQSVTVPTPDTQAPTAPGLTGSATGSTVTLNWTAATDNVGVTGYSVFRNGVQQGANLAATARSFSQTNVAAGTYAYVVRAFDAAGNSTPSNSVSITVASTNVAPTVTARTPVNGAFSVGVGNNVTATFSEAVVGVSTGTFQVRNPAGTVIAGAVSQSTTNARQWILNPTNNLAPDTRYTVTLTGGTTAIRDAQGAALVGTTAQPLTWSFTTGPAPRVTNRTPAVGATGTSRTANVTATFNEAVTGVSGTTFTLRSAAGSVAAVVSYNATTRVATLNPNATLAANTQYTATLTRGITDVAGNPLAANITWSFTTGAA